MEDAELSNPNIIGSLFFTWVKHDGQGNNKKKNKKEELQDINSEGKDNTSKENVPESLVGGGNKVKQEEKGEEYKKDKGEVAPLKDPITEAETSRKRNVSLQKSSARKKSQANKS